MKTNYKSKGLALATAFVVGILGLSAKTVYIEQNGVRYYWNNTKDYVEVTSPAKGNTYVGDISVPESIAYEGKELPVTAVRSDAFAETAVTSVTLPASVTSIGDYAFDTCDKIKKVTMPGVKTIGHWSFRNCYALESLDFSDNLVSIGNYCFDKNLKITQVTLPATVTNLGGYVFEGNPQLTTITCYATNPPEIKKGYLDGVEIYTIFDDEDYGNRVLYVPKGCVDAYKKSLGWHHFGNNIKELQNSGIETVADNTISVVAKGAGTVCVTVAAPTRIDVVNLNGRIVKSVTAGTGATTISNLPSGLLLVNGAKVFVR